MPDKEERIVAHQLPVWELNMHATLVAINVCLESI